MSDTNRTRSHPQLKQRNNQRRLANYHGVADTDNVTHMTPSARENGETLQRETGPESRKRKRIRLVETQTSAWNDDCLNHKSFDDNVRDVLQFLLLRQHKKVPVKRCDIIKATLDGDSTKFATVMHKVEVLLSEVFGIRMIGVEKLSERSSSFGKFVLVSKYPKLVTDHTWVFDQAKDEVRGFLFAVLALCFMLNRRNVEENVLWQFYQEVFFNTKLCMKREDFRKFLAREYVSNLYLNLEEFQDAHSVSRLYSWGIRSENEFNKTSILHFVSKLFDNVCPKDFAAQYKIAVQEEGENAFDGVNWVEEAAEDVHEFDEDLWV